METSSLGLRASCLSAPPFQHPPPPSHTQSLSCVWNSASLEQNVPAEICCPSLPCSLSTSQSEASSRKCHRPATVQSDLEPQGSLPSLGAPRSPGKPLLCPISPDALGPGALQGSCWGAGSSLLLSLFSSSNFKSTSFPQKPNMKNRKGVPLVK